MQLLQFIPTAVLALAAQAVASPKGYGGCIDTTEAYSIANNYLDTFQTNSKGKATGLALINKVFAPNLTYHDLGASFGNPAPLYDSRAAFRKAQKGVGYVGSVVTDVQYTTLFAFASCDIVTLRWASDSLSASAENVYISMFVRHQLGERKTYNCFSTVPAGTPIHYLGTDYVQVDLSTRLIYNATSSSDLLNFYIQLGDDVMASMM